MKRAFQQCVLFALVIVVVLAIGTVIVQVGRSIAEMGQ